ncbi:MAG: 50S ribosomal protein L18 [Gammaproteobacteria bacterium]
MEKKDKRQRRARRTRAKIKRLGVSRLCVHRTPRHIYAQLIAPDGASVLATASTVTKELKKSLKATGNKDAAVAVGKLIAERAKAVGVDRVAFDRSGFQYHGRIKALADAAREAGLDF